MLKIDIKQKNIVFLYIAPGVDLINKTFKFTECKTYFMMSGVICEPAKDGYTSKYGLPYFESKEMSVAEFNMRVLGATEIQ